MADQIPIAFNGISNPQKIRVLVYQSNTLAHVPLSSLLKSLTDEIASLSTKLDDAVLRIKTLEDRS